MQTSGYSGLSSVKMAVCRMAKERGAMRRGLFRLCQVPTTAAVALIGISNSSSMSEFPYARSRTYISLKRACSVRFINFNAQREQGVCSLFSTFAKRMNTEFTLYQRGGLSLSLSLSLRFSLSRCPFYSRSCSTNLSALLCAVHLNTGMKRFRVSI